MADLARTVVCLRIFGDDLDPDEITRLMGRAPTGASRKGDVRQSKATETVRARTGSWRCAIEDRSPGDLDGQIRSLLSMVTDDLDVWRDLSRRHACEVFCGLFMSESNEGAGLDPETLSMLGDRGLRIGFDIYGPLRD